MAAEKDDAIRSTAGLQDADMPAWLSRYNGLHAARVILEAVSHASRTIGVLLCLRGASPGCPQNILEVLLIVTAQVACKSD